MLIKQKKSHGLKGSRFLVSITVPGSAGLIRFVVNEDELVADVIDTAVKSYAREGRLPVLGSDLDTFMLYCPITGTEALLPWQTIGSVGFRNFMLCKKPEKTEKSIDIVKATAVSRKVAGRWRAWFHRSLSLNKISSH